MSSRIADGPEAIAFEALPEIDRFFNDDSEITVTDKKHWPSIIVGPSEKDLKEIIEDATTIYDDSEPPSPEEDIHNTTEPTNFTDVRSSMFFSTDLGTRKLNRLTSFLSITEEGGMQIRSQIGLNVPQNAHDIMMRLLRKDQSTYYGNDTYGLTIFAQPKVDQRLIRRVTQKDPESLTCVFHQDQRPGRKILIYPDPKDPRILVVTNNYILSEGVVDNIDIQELPPKPRNPKDIHDELVSHTAMMTFIADVIQNPNHKIKKDNEAKKRYHIGTDTNENLEAQEDSMRASINTYKARMQAEQEYVATYIEHYSPHNQGGVAPSTNTTLGDVIGTIDDDAKDKTAINSIYTQLSHQNRASDPATDIHHPIGDILSQLRDIYMPVLVRDDREVVEEIVTNLLTVNYNREPNIIPQPSQDKDPGNFTLESIRTSLDPEIYEVLASIVRHRFSDDGDLMISSDLGSEPKRTILMHGEPGGGKTYAIRALINSLEAGWIRISGDDLNKLFVGASERAINEKLSKIYSPERTWPIVIVIDEVEKILNYSSSSADAGGAVRSANSLFSKFLILLDDIQQNRDGKYKDVYVVLSGNEIGDLHESMIRSGRIGYHLQFKKPTPKMANVFFADLVKKHEEAPKKYMRNLRVFELDIDFDAIGKAMHERNFSIADIHRVFERSVEIMTKRCLEQKDRRAELLAKRLGKQRLSPVELEMIVESLQPQAITNDDLYTIINNQYMDMQNARN